MDGKEKKLDQFEIEAKTSGGAVFELGVKTPSTTKQLGDWHNHLWTSIGKTQDKGPLHRVYRVAEYLLKRFRGINEHILF